MKVIALLRGITPTGKNRIPKMSYLAQILQEAGFQNVKTYIQSGNIILDTELSEKETEERIHNTILKKIGANLSVIIKRPNQLQIAVKENPFDETHEYSRIHLVFTNDSIEKTKIEELKNRNFEEEKFMIGSECLYMYLPRNARKKKLNTNYLERQLSITATMRKLNVIEHLIKI
ncbi:DUF1697 domain-containing protein [Fusobacterium necrophorum]|uniref:DUF1697 domain-containing protein n=1 Tax=Fusobacterium necrophorum TaxID=859 RepID=UPI000245DD17|nr:DUF1697 domain-containing protein [Fusobacterium necrophorum]EHO19810.1 hypothetical protein HMPREF9466_01741 [Fusobacterium necrophorum subsp. funduliforme 1_1_36S]AVQ21337.1 DUF1697 domain-containing protein [Fusobacterium necrophorum subsp. funduliforme]MBR8722222.1 hypothetical protein [Fusobacterium necrophorum subsp. funduliforme]MCI7342951.1 DUF1697 domain-containing protein [Fusobacterium necrophorum]MDY2574257.1 DUF1697 domain-containing protein [Fusobacterium necrophorum]